MEKGKIPVSDRVAAVLTDVKVDDGARASILRRRKKLTLAEVARAIGTHEHKISEMERGFRRVSDEYVTYLSQR